MRVRIEVEFEVTPQEDMENGEELGEFTAIAAADMAAWNFLALVKESTQGGEVESVSVHVDGFGACNVSLVER